ncbi:MAG: hypothetical protein WCO11_08545 [Sphingomonadales bacterium]|jgi:outer membrane lipoprotein SlyB
MRTPIALAMSLAMALPALAPISAQPHQTVYEFKGKRYATLAQCLHAKERAKERGAIAGAVIAGVGTALLGGNVGETALVAGGGALAGRELGRTSTRQC